MENINLAEYMTREEVQEALGCSARGFWRALDRAGRDEVSITFLGRTLVRKKSLDALKQCYYPRGSDARSEMSKAWGARGGHAKAANAAAKARRAKRKSST